ncbi:MAG: heavy metal translocating P-type ATPase [Calothrix sp. C42_A2020_038]|nr:heavy metal translocating P-type ATPase [Calothrix sp. C42_A2020_038]
MYAITSGAKQKVVAQHMAWKVNYKVVHSTHGRVRFRVPLLALDQSYASRLESLLLLDSCVTKVRVNCDAASVTVNYQATQNNLIPARLLQIIQDATWKEEIKRQRVETHHQHHHHEHGDDGLKMPALATLMALLKLAFPIPTALVASTVAIAALPVCKRAFTSIRDERKLNIDCLDFLAIVLTSLQGNLLAPALVMTLHEVGDTIRERTARVTHQSATDLLSSLGSFAWVEKDGEKVRVLATEVQPGDKVIVYPGEQIPVDGKILRGKALIDFSKLTGESMPVVRSVGEYVYASTLVREGTISVNTERVGCDTRAGASIRLMQEAPVYDTRMVNHAAQIADKTIVPALIFAGIVFAATRNPVRAASILTLDFMTGIRVSLPTTYLAALNHATRHGVLVRSGRALEKLAQVDTLVFDKTGTLTQGEIEVIGLETVLEVLPQRVLELAAAAEQRLTHPVAQAVMRYATQQNLRILPRGEWNYEIGLGVSAQIEDEYVLVGSARWMEQNNISIQTLNDNSFISVHDSRLYVAANGELLGAIVYTDPLRLESAEVIRKLQLEHGMSIHLLTGDNKQRATTVAKELGIPVQNVYAEAFPEQKAEIIRNLHSQGKTVAFTGDGINDSAALAYADVSISFGNGSQIARETADVVLMENNLENLLEAIAIAQETKQVINQNIGLAVIPNLAALGLAATTGIHPLAATTVHNGSAIAAGLNGLRPLMHQDPPQTVFSQDFCLAQY